LTYLSEIILHLVRKRRISYDNDDNDNDIIISVTSRVTSVTINYPISRVSWAVCLCTHTMYHRPAEQHVACVSWQQDHVTRCWSPAKGSVCVCVCMQCFKPGEAGGPQPQNKSVLG